MSRFNHSNYLQIAAGRESDVSQLFALAKQTREAADTARCDFEETHNAESFRNAVTLDSEAKRMDAMLGDEREMRATARFRVLDGNARAWEALQKDFENLLTTSEKKIESFVAPAVSGAEAMIRAGGDPRFRAGYGSSFGKESDELDRRLNLVRDERERHVVIQQKISICKRHSEKAPTEKPPTESSFDFLVSAWFPA